VNDETALLQEGSKVQENADPKTCAQQARTLVLLRYVAVFQRCLYLYYYFELIPTIYVRVLSSNLSEGHDE
jgi:hypothetical protein